MGRFIVMEGLDGSGKSTQVSLLSDYFKENKIPYQYIHFPRQNEPVIGEMISKFLRGEYGRIEDIDPYFVALLYATDRGNAKSLVNGWLEREQYVLMDRYVYSNVAFQCAKIADAQNKIKLRDWILKLEYEYNAIPKPDISLFLYAPFESISNALKQKRQGDDRKYLKGMEDIHESSADLQKKVEAEYLSLIESDSSFKLINCCQNDAGWLPPHDIHKAILREIL